MANAAQPRLTLTDPQQKSLRLAGLLQVLAAALWAVQALAIAAIIGGWASGGTGPTLLWAGVFLAIALLRAALDHRAGRWTYAVADAVIHAQRQTLLARETRLLRGDLSSAEIAAMVTQKLPLLAPYLTRYRPAMDKVKILPLIFLALVFPISWAAGLVLLVAGPLIPVFMALVGMAAKDASARQMVEIGDMNRLLIDRIAAMPDARMLGGAARSRAAFADAADRLRERTMAVLRIAFLSSTVLELFAAIGVAMVAVYVGFSLLGEIPFGAWATPLTLAEGAFILLIAPEFFQPLRDLAAAWHDKAAAEAVLEELEALSVDPPAPILGQATLAPALPGPATIGVTQATVRRGDTVLALPDLAANPGEAIALRGPSGAGKSTLLDLIAGLVRPDSGQVSVAGRALDDDTADAWRMRCALVPQIVHIPQGSVAEFLDPHATGRDPAQALHRARADTIVARLPDGLQTVLGETGAGVSGGEARRLMLARAFLSGADVILADEPTADLDRATAAQIIAALRDAAAGGVTVIAASHDPDLIAVMDRIVTLEARA